MMSSFQFWRLDEAQGTGDSLKMCKFVIFLLLLHLIVEPVLADGFADGRKKVIARE